jgi:tetratricopeptide (TPR) repeat protein
LAGLALSGATSWRSTQEIVGEHDVFLQLSQQFSEAVAIFEDPQRQSQSIEFFGQIISAIEDERRVNEKIPTELEELQQRAYEYRAQAYFNSGQLQGAADDFRQLILANPRYVLDEDALSPKIIDFYEDQKKQLVGYIAVNSEPPGARVTVNGTFVGITNFFPIEVHTGAARVEVNLEGYDPIVGDAIEILPGEIRTLEFAMIRNSAKLPVITQPSGVEVWVDGRQAGTTAGSLPPDLRSFMPAEFDPDRLSAPLDLAALPLGQHLIELKRDCYETTNFSINVEQPQDYSARIVKLEESIGQLRLTSNPAGARVFIDGEYKGNTPLDLNRVCSGTHHLEVKHTTGRYVADVVVAKNEDLSLDCPIRPTMAFLGLASQEGVSERDLADMRESITAGLQTLTAMNLIIVPGAQTSTLLGGERLEALVAGDVVPGAGTSRERVRALSERIGEALEVEALLVGYVPAQRLTKDVVFNLLATGSSTPDTFTINYLDREALPRFVDELSATTPLHGSWIGLTTVDTLVSAGPVVLQLSPEGPAAQAGLQIGDIMLLADGLPASDTLAFVQKIRGKEPGSSLALQVERQGTTSDITVTVGTTPLEVPLNQEGFLYNKAIIDFRHRIVTEPSVESLARLNLALCYMALGDFETPLREHLPRITLPETRGISQGTVLYHTGVCYERLEERAEAVRVFQEALGYPEATLQTNDGPRVGPLAERKLRELAQ